MTQPMTPQNRLEIRQAVGHNLSGFFTGTTTGNGSTTTMVDAYGMARGGDDQYNGYQIQINTTVTSGAAVGQKPFVSFFSVSTDPATVAPAVDATIKSG